MAAEGIRFVFRIDNPAGPMTCSEARELSSDIPVESSQPPQ
jgi:hypothetical protein